MLGSFLTRGLVLVFGYAYPAYECYKTVERNKPEIEQLLFWCQYWILVAVLTVCERVGDAFISWVPMYSEAKLAFFIYLWYPKTKGTSYVYDSFFKPYVAKHENEIDRNLLELRTRAGDMAILYWQRAASYGQTRIFEVLQFVAAQSTPRPRPTQSKPPQQGPSIGQGPAGSNSQPSQKVPVVDEDPPSPTSSIASSQDQKDLTEVAAPSNVPKLAPYKMTYSAPATVLPVKSAAPVPPAKAAAPVPPAKAAAPSITSARSLPADPVTSKTETAPPAVNEKPEPPPKETVMDETLRRTRGRLRKARSVPSSQETE